MSRVSELVQPVAGMEPSVAVLGAVTRQDGGQGAGQQLVQSTPGAA